MLIAIDRGARDGWNIGETLTELGQLAGTAGAEVAGQLVQKMPQPNRLSYIGKGKIEELVSLKEELNYTTAIFDDELTPSQQHYLGAGTEGHSHRPDGAYP